MRAPHKVKKKSFDLGGNRTHDLRLSSTVTLPTELRGRTEKVGGDLGGELRLSLSDLSSVGRVMVDLIQKSWVRFPPRSKDFFFTSCGSLIPFTRASAQWVIHGSISTLIYTSEFILCSIICVHSATWHIHLFAG